jgi:propionyl-CoA synthetase
MRRIADGDEYTTPATIDDPATLDEMEAALRELGYARAPAASIYGG